MWHKDKQNKETPHSQNTLKHKQVAERGDQKIDQNGLEVLDNYMTLLHLMKTHVRLNKASKHHSICVCVCVAHATGC